MKYVGPALELSPPLAVTQGGTGANTAAAARASIGAVGLTGNETVAGNKTWTGSQTIQTVLTLGNGSGQANFQFHAPSGFPTIFDFRNTTGGARWRLAKDATPEDGGNVGSNYVLSRYQDTGNSFGGSASTVLTITRSTAEMAYRGVIRPFDDNARDLGTASFRWREIFAANAVINTSDERLKQDIKPISEDLLDAWGNVGWCTFRFRAAYDSKGEAARWHMGLIAQRVRDAIDAASGEDTAIRLGLVCYDAWDALPEVTRPVMAERVVSQDAEGNPIVEEYDTGEVEVVQEAREAGDLWGLRYEECFAVEAAWQRREIARQNSRIAALEAALADRA